MLPNRVVQLSRFKEKPTVSVKELKVVTMDVEHSPPPDLFRLDFKPGQRLINQFTNQTLLVQSGHMDLDWFATDGMLRDGIRGVELYADTMLPVIAAGNNSVPRWPFDGSRGSSVLFWACVALGSIAAICAVLLRLRRRRSP
jgi:hypothetical protein